jgi:ADP-ribose pyrophosphatase YjhB (NUDIX family)
MKIKKSYGLICCRKDPKLGLQIILIKKPVTYHFCEFVLGNYSKNDEAHLIKLFNNMTYHEKMDILSFKFNTMWYRIYKKSQEKLMQEKYFTTKKVKFETSFLYDGGARLKKLIANTVNAETLWEIPKGRCDEYKNECLVNASIREFSEETLISEDKYELMLHIKPYIETYSDFGVTYQNIYYYCKAIGNWSPNIVFSNGKQISEVSAVRWCSILDINSMQLDPTTHKRLKTMFKKIVKKYKTTKKYPI